MRDTNLVKALREHAEWARANVYEAPIALYDDLTKAELLQVVEMLAFGENKYYLDRALGRIEMQRNDAHFERCRKLIDEEQKHYAAYFDLLRPYEGKPIVDVPQDVLEQAQAEFDKARAAGQEWNRRNGIKLKGRVSDEKMHR